MPNSKRPVWRTATQFLTTPSLARSISALMALGLVLLLVANIGTFVMIRRTDKANEAQARAQDARLLMRDVRSRLLNLETGQRGYLLTGETEYLEPYAEAKVELPTLMRELETLARSDPELAPPVQRLKDLAEERLALGDRTVDLARMGQFSSAREMVRSGRGKALMDGIRVEIDQAEAVQSQTIRELYGLGQRNAATTVAINALAGVLILVLGAIAGWLIRRYVLDMQEANAELDEMNLGLEETIETRTAALSRANEEVQRYAYIVSHDLRAPLVNVMGYTSELERANAAFARQLESVREKAPQLIQAEAEVAVVEDAPEAIGFIRTSTEKMDRLINAILKLSREGRRTLVPEPLDMNRLIRDIVASVNHQAEAAGAKIVVADLPSLDSDRLSMDQIFGNLIDNALKYLDAGRAGRIEVTGETIPSGERIYRVADNGRGISGKDHERVFDLFRRAGKQDQPGEGLGLAFVRSSVRRLGGDVRLESSLDQGATFILSFPAQLSRDDGDPNE